MYLADTVIQSDQTPYDPSNISYYRCKF